MLKRTLIFPHGSHHHDKNVIVFVFAFVSLLASDLMEVVKMFLDFSLSNVCIMFARGSALFYI